MRDIEGLTLLLGTLQAVQAGSRPLDMRVVADLGLSDSVTGVRSAGEVICFRLRPTASTDRHTPWLPDPSPTQSIDHAWALAQLVLGDGVGLNIVLVPGENLAQAEIVPGLFTEAATIPLAILATTVEALVSRQTKDGDNSGQQ